MPKIKKRIWIPALVVLILALAIGAVMIYASDYYRADIEKIDEYMGAVEYSIEGGRVTVGDSNSDVGFIFYPGGKVEFTAYIPLLRDLAKGGVFCVIEKMPLNLAVLDSGAAADVMSEYASIKKWYIGGHSLGGSMAASFADENDKIAGLVLLASYSTANLSDDLLPVLSIYGDKDGVLNMEKYDKYESNLPKNKIEHILAGANHAGFGMYGAQDGDNVATMTNGEQIDIAASLILDFIK